VTRPLKITITAVITIAVLAILAIAIISFSAASKQERIVDVAVAPIDYPTTSAALTHGEYLYRSRGCMECHGADGHGRVFIDDPSGLYVKAPNITPGASSPTANYTSRDWMRSIRHGLDPQGHPLLIMPSEDYNRLTDDDLAALVAYVLRLPPTQGGQAEIRMPLMVKFAYAVGLMQDAAEKIDHRLPPARPVPVGATATHGAYVANMCMGCHGADLSGGKIPGAPPDWPAAADLRPSAKGAMAHYQQSDAFTRMMRTGLRPDGSQVSKVMPFASLAQLNDTDLAALHLYLQALPAANHR
jgi:cytochrome c553